LPLVSGKNPAKIPARHVGTPRTNSGRGCQYFARVPTKGALRPTARANMEQVPMA